MVAVTFASYNTLYGTTFLQAYMDAVLDQAINLLNLYSNVTLSNLAAGTVTLTSAETGAVLTVAKAIVESREPDSKNAMGVGINPVRVNPDSVARRAAQGLCTYSFELV